MAFAKQEKNHPVPDRNETRPDGSASPVPPAKIDEMLLDALDALEQTHKLHETTPNPETKRQTKRILESLHSSLIQLAPLGIHSAQRLARVSVAPG